MKAVTTGVVLMLAVLAGGRPAVSLAASVGRPAPSPSPSEADSAVARGVGESGPSQKIIAALQQMHMTACAGSVQQITNFLFEGQDADFTAQPLGPDSDRWPTVFVIESASPSGGHNRFATLMIAPNCSGMYEQMIYWPQPCSTIKSTVFSKYAGGHPILGQIEAYDASPALQVYLTSAGAGCISVKKELFR